MANETGNVIKKEANLPVTGMFEQDASQGLENMDQQDLALPFLRILGQLSPQVNKRDSKYVEGAEPGMIYNTVTHELYDGTKGINVVPCYYKREYIEWQDRGEGSGAPVAIHAASSGIINEATRDSINKDRLKNGNYLENTASYFVIVSKDNGAETALITMKSTQLKVSKNWNSIMSGIKLQGKIQSFDQFVILLENTVNQMVYKHAISTVVPARAVNFQSAQGNDGAEHSSSDEGNF